MFSPASICRWMYRYVCEQLLGTNSSPIVTHLGQSYPWPWEEVIKFWKVKVGGGGMHCTERHSSF